MRVLEIKRDNGARAEVRKLYSGSYSIMFFPQHGLDGDLTDCYPSDHNFFTADEAAQVALLWILG